MRRSKASWAAGVNEWIRASPVALSIEILDLPECQCICRLLGAHTTSEYPCSEPIAFGHSQIQQELHKAWPVTGVG